MNSRAFTQMPQQKRGIMLLSLPININLLSFKVFAKMIFLETWLGYLKESTIFIAFRQLMNLRPYPSSLNSIEDKNN
jgi:hypothetical protein